MWQWNDGGRQVAERYRRSTAIYTMVMAGAVGLFVFWVLFNLSDPVTVGTVSATVTSVAPMRDDARQYGWLLELALPDGRRTRLLSSRRPDLQPGATVRLREERYAGGEVLYAFESPP